MSEYATGYNNPPEQEVQPTLPDMELINFVERMSPDERMQAKRRYLSEISDREKLCNLIDTVNDIEGIDVELIG